MRANIAFNIVAGNRYVLVEVGAEREGFERDNAVILAELVHQLVSKEQYHIPIYIRINMDAYDGLSIYPFDYALGYEAPSGKYADFWSEYIMYPEHLVISCSLHPENFRNILKLVDYGIKNSREIKDAQCVINLRRKYQYQDSVINSIDNSAIYKILNSNSSFVDSVLHERTYRNVARPEARRLIDYYYKDSSYCFINY